MVDMSSDGIPLPVALIGAVIGGNVGGVKVALEAGASVNGPPDQPCAPIVVATITNHADIVQFLLEQGADPDRPVLEGWPCPWLSAAISTTISGERALHVAARCGNVQIVRLLLKRSRADPNATDNTGRTPLMATCQGPLVCARVVRLLLEAGADTALAGENGSIPLHYVALNGRTDLVDMLYSRAPTSLNRCDAEGRTPLFMACYKGHEVMVSKLLSLGAIERMVPNDGKRCPLWAASYQGFVGVVRLLITKGGIRAVGGSTVLPRAFEIAVVVRRPRVLRLLLTVDGEKMRSEWANLNIRGLSLLCVGAAFYCPATVSVLLEAGADEAAGGLDGVTPLYAMGRAAGLDEIRRDRGKGIAICRMLTRGPAYRARSWAWPTEEEADADGRVDGDTSVVVAAAAAAAAAAAVRSSPPAVKTFPVIGVRIFRPNEQSSGKFFVKLVGRYCAKEY